MRIEDWIASPSVHWARARRRIYDSDGSYAPRGSVGEVVDLLPYDAPEGYVVVDFPETGPMLCYPSEVNAAS